MQFEIREELPEDHAFLFDLFRQTHGAHLAMLPPAMMRMQFEAQYSHYRTRHPDASFAVITAGGERAGRLCVARSESHAHIVDIAILPSLQGRGLGTAVITSLQLESKPIRLSVRPDNPARRLYERLGFTLAAGQGPFLFMEWRPSRG